ncbi:type II toxin-antitoxin system PemK/MazF family toxin [Streptomyces sp. NPDC006512]|uniref:type II toxin-antitoxin system PemK/MazF family toxin n=1 Tax=Streptomyces sp. NPDC006512 TaxID=3154307 RepID=UPI0033AB0E89
MTELRRGDVIAIGEEGRGGLWVVVSNDTRNALLDTVVVAQIGTGSDTWPTAVPFEAADDGILPGHLPDGVGGHVLTDFLTTVRPAAHYVETVQLRLSPDALEAVSAAVRLAVP